MKKVKPVVDTRMRSEPQRRKPVDGGDGKEYVLEPNKPKPLSLGKTKSLSHLKMYVILYGISTHTH